MIRLPRRGLGRVRKVRAKANGRRLRVRLVRPRRAKVSLRRLARPGSYRVKVVAWGTYGRRVKVTRRYRLCG